MQGRQTEERTKGRDAPPPPKKKVGWLGFNSYSYSQLGLVISANFCCSYMDKNVQQFRHSDARQQLV